MLLVQLRETTQTPLVLEQHTARRSPVPWVTCCAGTSLHEQTFVVVIYNRRGDDVDWRDWIVGKVNRCGGHARIMCTNARRARSPKQTPRFSAPLPRMTEARNEAFGSPCWGSNPSHPADWRSALPVELHGQRHIWFLGGPVNPSTVACASCDVAGVRPSSVV